MILPLLRKELRAQRPMRWLVLFFVAVTAFIELAIGSPLGHSVEHIFDEFLIINAGQAGWIYAIFTFAISSGILVREFDDKTIEFLDALPLSRSSLFWAKFIAGFSSLAIMPIAFAVIGFVWHRCAANSLDRNWHMDLIIQSVVLQLLQMLILFSIGLACSYLRRFGWLALGILITMFMVIKNHFPGAEVLNVLALADSEFIGSERIIPWRMIAFQTPIGLAALAFAYLLFIHGGQWLIELSKPGRSPARQAVMWAGGIGVVTVFLGLAIYISFLDDEEGPEDPHAVTVVYPSWSTARVSTKHYDITYPTNLSNRSLKLAKQADEIHDSVASLFGYTPTTKITADWTASSSHFLGTAYWMKLKMSLGGSEPDELRRTLAHETTHVVIESLSDNQLREHFESTRCFHEGVATYIERQLCLTDAERTKERLAAAVMHDRGEVDFHTLIIDSKFRREQASEMVYDLGEVFAAATVDCYGADSLGKLARAFAEKRNTEGLTGTPLWRSVFQANGYSLNRVINQFYDILDRTAKQQKAEIDSLPLAKEVASEIDGAIYIIISQQPPEGWEFVCRFRGRKDSADTDYFRGLDVDDGFVAGRSSFPRSTAWYQVGLRRGKITIYEPWKSVPLN